MTRRHDIDVLRTLAFGLLILYHVAMVYVAEWGFHIKSSHTSEFLQWPMIFVNRWRMSLLFLLSGLAVGLALARLAQGPGRFAARRSWRLLLPLAFGMIATVPVQAYCEALANGVIEPGFTAFMGRYLQFQPWPEGGFAGARYGVTWNHLWYLVYLWAYSMLLALMLPLLRTGPGRRLADSGLAPGRWRGVGLVLLPAAYLLVCLYWLAPRFPSTHSLFDDWANHAQYLPVFLFGAAVARAQGFWEELLRLRRRLLALALTSIAVYLGLRWLGRTLTPEQAAAFPDWNWRAISDGAHVLYRWTALLSILGYGYRYLNRPYGWLPYANQAVYPWYILHQSLIVPLAFVLGALALPGWLEFGLVLGGTVLGCALLHEFVIRRLRWLRPLFGIGPQRYDEAGAGAGKLAPARGQAAMGAGQQG